MFVSSIDTAQHEVTYIDAVYSLAILLRRDDADQLAVVYVAGIKCHFE